MTLLGLLLVYLVVMECNAIGGRSGGFLSFRDKDGHKKDVLIDKDQNKNKRDSRFITKEDVNERIKQRRKVSSNIGNNNSEGTRGRLSGNFESTSPAPSAQQRRGLLSYLPNIHVIIDPVINFKFRQRIDFLGAATTIGFDYLTDVAQYRLHCIIEDRFVGGRFSLRGNELGWAKSFYANLDALHGLGLGMDNKAKIKLRCGLNLRTWQAYLRVRLRSEPINSFNIADGLTLYGKLPLMSALPLRVEYRSRLLIPKLRIASQKRFFDSMVSLSTGLDRLDVSLEELNLCLEFDQKSPVWDIGLTRPDPFSRFRRAPEERASSASSSSINRNKDPRNSFYKPTFSFPSYSPV